ncbi:MAG TPA: glycosyltransferase family 4 protein, partial [Paracoccus sp.]|nr:glycosyltransferase family 4 protein [Paracoccus sp. (in: a-proteobacteria)]
EAMAQRRAVISTYIAGIPELVRPGENGWLVPAGTIDELAGAMAASITLSPDDMRALRLAAFERVRARHGIDREAGKLKALFQGQG